jgi:hypothetical protein
VGAVSTKSPRFRSSCCSAWRLQRPRRSIWPSDGAPPLRHRYGSPRPTAPSRRSDRESLTALDLLEPWGLAHVRNDSLRPPVVSGSTARTLRRRRAPCRVLLPAVTHPLLNVIKPAVHLVGIGDFKHGAFTSLCTGFSRYLARPAISIPTPATAQATASRLRSSAL